MSFSDQMNGIVKGMKEFAASEADRLRHLDAIGWMEEGCLIASLAMLGTVIGLCITQSEYIGDKAPVNTNGSAIEGEDLSEYTEPESGTVTDFGDFNIEEHYLTAYSVHKPTEEELKAYMPSTIEVYLDDNYETSTLKVDWKCVEVDYAGTDLYYYQFSPEWDQETFPLDASLNLQADGPYVGVFLDVADEFDFDGSVDNIPSGVIKVGGKAITEASDAAEESDEETAAAGDSESMDDDTSDEWDDESGYYDMEDSSFSSFGDDILDDYSDAVTTTAEEADVYDYLVNELGLNEAAACGVMANIHAKSYFRAENLQDSYEESLGYDDLTYTEEVDSGSYMNFADDQAGYGLLGWSDQTQKNKLLAYSEDNYMTIGDWEMQMGFLEGQLEDDYKNVWSYLSAVPNTEQGAYDAAYYWCYYYEKGDNYATTAISRGNLARNKYWDQYGKDDSSFSYGYDNNDEEYSTEDSGEDYEFDDYDYENGEELDDDMNDEDYGDESASSAAKKNTSSTTKSSGYSYTYGTTSSAYRSTAQTYQSYNSYQTTTTRSSYYNTRVEATAIKVSESTLTLKKGSTHTLKATLTPSNSTDTVSWNTGNSSIATVSGGTVKAMGTGTTSITARSSSGKSATCKVTVVSPVTAPKLTIDKTSPFVGETVKVSWDKQEAATGYKIFITLDKNTVSKKLTNTSYSFKPTKGGEYKIKVRAYNSDYKKMSKESTINVKVLVSTLTLNKETLTLSTGKTEKLTATMGPEGSTGDEISEWTSSDSKVATVASNGKVTAVAAGSCTIQVKTKNGLTAKCKVTVVDKPAILTQPENLYAQKGDQVIFFVETEGKKLTYQWQCKTTELNATWTDCKETGAKTAYMTLDATNSMTGYSYRCIVSNSAGESVTSDAATLTVGYIEPTILTQPEDCRVPAGSTASFSVEALGEGLTYQWEYKEDVVVEKPEDAVWYSVSGTQTDTLTIDAVTEEMSGRTYRCTIKDSKGKSVTSESAMLKTGQGIVITRQPENHAVDIGDQVSFVTAAEGDSLTYQWEYRSANGTKWKTWKQTTSTSAKLKVKITAYMNGMRFRCVITDANGYHRTTRAAIVTRVTEGEEESTEESSVEESETAPSKTEPSSEQTTESPIEEPSSTQAGEEESSTEESAQASEEGLLSSLFKRKN